MGYEANTGLGVSSHYGERPTGGVIGHINTEGAYKELALEITGKSLNESYNQPVYIPAGALIVSAFAEVKEVFALGGTTPAIEIGTEGTEATNGVTITEAQAEAVSTIDLTSALSGTWGSALAADTAVGVALSGTSPTSSDSTGEVRVVVRYINL